MTDILILVVAFVLLGFIGLIIGILLSAIFRRPSKERWFYIIGQVIVFSSVFLWAYIENKPDTEKSDNVKHNHIFVGLYPPSADTLFEDQEYIQRAFHTLERSFKSPNDFHLTFFATTTSDTTTAQGDFSVSYIYFAYKDSTKSEHFSKIAVLPDTSVMLIFNGDAHHDRDFKKFRTDSENSIRLQFQEVKKQLDSLPDSTRRRIGEAMREALAD
jgi:hypothetical protein